jgi:hypothetical protein
MAIALANAGVASQASASSEAMEKWPRQKATNLDAEAERPLSGPEVTKSSRRLAVSVRMASRPAAVGVPLGDMEWPELSGSKAAEANTRCSKANAWPRRR